MNLQRVDLLGSEGLVLSVAPGVGPATVARFCRLFGEVWDGLDHDVRHPLLGFWWARRQALADDHPAPCPFILLTPQLRNPDTRDELTGLYCAREGMIVLSFHAARLDALPDDLAECLIGHELAHAFLHAVSGVSGEEDLTDAVTASWRPAWKYLMPRLRGTHWFPELGFVVLTSRNRGFLIDPDGGPELDLAALATAGEAE